MDENAPKSLKCAALQEQRRAHLWDEHMKPLTAYAVKLRAQIGLGYIPEFDPLDGGTKAQVLFLFEKPGPLTFPPNGSGFISRNNNDPTAGNTCRFMAEAGLNRKDTLLWNTIPGWNKTVKIADSEVPDGLAYLPALLTLLKEDLKVVVLVGKKAERAQRYLRHLPVITSTHPSNRARGCAGWKEIRAKWALAKTYITK